jgi:hypothetical protein
MYSQSQHACLPPRLHSRCTISTIEYGHKKVLVPAAVRFQHLQWLHVLQAYYGQTQAALMPAHVA